MLNLKSKFYQGSVVRQAAETAKTEIMNIFKDLKDKGKCVILVSHSPEVAAFCDEIYELKKNKKK